jgi:Tfp pilus assembly protein PilX
MVVALTIGLSVASRSIINLRTSQEQAGSQKALSAAEAGVEQAIKAINNGQTAIPAGDFEGGNVKYKTDITQVSGADKFLLNGGYSITKDSHVYIWTTSYSETNPWANPWNGNLTIYWGDTNVGCQDAALEISVISGSKTNPTLTKSAYDPCPSRIGSNGFDAVSQNRATIGITELWYQVSLNNLTDVYLVSVNPVYSNSRIGASGSNALPSQGNNISSVGKADNEQIQRKVSAFQGFPQIPAELFPYTIFSP